MRSFQGLSLLASVASVAFAQNTTPAGSTPSCPAYSCAGGAQATIASSLSGYAPASSLCSSSYVRPQTCSAFGATSTIRTTVATVTTQVIAQTATVTITGTTRTFTNTVSTTPSTTITVTSSFTSGTSTTSIVVIPETTLVNPNKRQVTTRSGKIILPTIAPVTSIDRQSSLLSSLRASQSSAYIAAVCTCLVKPSSTTVTSIPAVTLRVTSTVSQRVALAVPTTFYPSTTITVTITAARVTRTVSTSVTTAFTSVTLTTTTETATTTADPVNPNSCTFGDPGALQPGDCGPVGAGCACYRDTADPVRGFCASFYGDCGPPCQVNSDCDVGLDCLAESETDGACGGNTCALPSDVTDCPNDAGFKTKRSTNPMAFKAIAKRAAKLRHQPPRL